MGIRRTQRNLGPASLAFPLSGALLAGGRLWLVSRYLAPTRIVALDASSLAIDERLSAVNGAGAWGLTAAHTARIYVGLFGARGKGNLLRIDADPDPAGPAATVKVVAALDQQYIWALASDGIGRVVGVGDPPLLFLYDPGTGRADNLGVVTATDRPRSVAVAGATAYVGGARGGRATLLTVDLATRKPTDVLPAALRDHATVYALASSFTHVAAGTQGPDATSAALAVFDRRTGGPPRITRVGSEAVVDAIALTPMTAYVGARRSGSLYRHDLQMGTMQLLATPVPGSETRGLGVVGQTVVGADASGSVWHHDLVSGVTTVRDLRDLGVPPEPELVQSVAADATLAYAAGHFGVQVRDQRSGAVRRFFVPGEAKDMVVVDGILRLALYPRGEVWSYDPAVGTAKPAGRLPTEQNRPQAITWSAARRALLVTTASDRLGGGALHSVDRDGGVETLTNPLGPGQHPAGVAAVGSTALVGGSGANPSLICVDLPSRRVLWTIDHAAPGGGTLIGMVALGDRVYGFTAGGWFLVVDPVGRRIVHRRQLLPSGGRIVAAGGLLYATSGAALVRVEPVTLQATTISQNLQARTWGWPSLAATGDGGVVFQRGDDLILLRETLT